MIEVCLVILIVFLTLGSIHRVFQIRQTRAALERYKREMAEIDRKWPAP